MIKIIWCIILLYNLPNCLTNSNCNTTNIHRIDDETMVKQTPKNLIHLLFGLNGINIRNCNDCYCGLPYGNKLNIKRLLGGQILHPYEFPWMALITIDKLNETKLGTLISDRYVITIASLINGLTPYDLKIELGVYDQCNPDITRHRLSCNEIITHPDYVHSVREHNIALIKLTNSIRSLFGRYILPICLPTPGARYIGQVSIIASWSTNKTSCVPKKIGLPILDSEVCPINNLKNQGCIGVVGTANSLCKDDSGTGVLYQTTGRYYELIGILIDQQQDDQLNVLPTYIQTNNYLNWILKMTNDGCYCKKI